MSEADRPANKVPKVPPLNADGARRAAPDAQVTLDISTSPVTPDSASLADSRKPSATSEATAKSIGLYRLVKKLGEGGMGQVWLAEQTEPLRRQVALKLIRVGTYDDAVLKRFQSERQSLAMMNHPSIAKVFDAGATPDGQPYFVMEYVPGVPLTDYCDQKRLKIPDRLELFIKVCEGVQHAHQKAIIHRDLKPANILVVEVDGKPMPRIIDFGLAKAAGPQFASESLYTQVGSFVGTPGYMSPEQADASIGDVDTRTDVYSLGVVLYVLLSGSLPFDPKQWQKTPLYEVLRQLREEEPPRPSTKFARENESSLATAENRGVQPKQLANLLHGDLDWIVMKAMEKDRARRYGTPSELAADITRYLSQEPVVARPASGSYRLQKYVRRHRMGVSVAASLVVLLAGFASMQAVQVRRVTRERDRANRITDFMTRMFKVSDPSEARGNTITAREILDKASKEIDSGLTTDPVLQTQMMDVMGHVYDDLGLYHQSETLLTRALQIRLRTLGPSSPDTLEAESSLGWALFRERHYAQAEKLLRETLDQSQRVLGPEKPVTLDTMRRLGLTLSVEGQRDEAEALVRKALEIQRRIAGPEDIFTVQTMDDLAHVLIDEGRLSEAELLFRQTLEINHHLRGPDDPQTLNSLYNLALIVSEEKRYPEAEKLAQEELEAARRILGPEHPTTLAAMHILGMTLASQGHLAEAEQLYREGLDASRRALGPDDPDTLAVMHSLATLLGNTGRAPEAEQLYREALAGSRRSLGPENAATVSLMNDLADTLSDERKYDEAEKLNQEALGIRRRIYGEDHPITASSTYNLACLAALKGKPDKALYLLRQALDHGLGPDLAVAMATDSDLKSLHGDPRFAALVAYAKEKAASQSHTN
jgi:eukaryotic-like serine/threonine-protein kinase